MRKAFLGAIVGAVIIVPAVLLGLAIAGHMDSFLDGRTQLVLREQNGTVTSGSKLGVRIGASWTEADATLRSQFEPAYVQWETGRYVDGSSDLVGLPEGPVLEGEARVAYRDRSWRNGVVSLRLSDGQVTEISWHYPGPLYIDL